MQAQFLYQIRQHSYQLGSWVVIVVIIFLLERVGWYLPLEKGLLVILQPIQAISLSAVHTVGTPFLWIQERNKTALEYEAVRAAYAQAVAQLSELEAVKKENEALKEMVGDSTKNRVKKRVVVPIISYSMTAVALGNEDGVQEGALIYVGDTLLGRVSHVEATQSFVTLFSDPISPPLLVQTETGVQGLLVGTEKRLELTQLPVQAVIQKGSRVTTVGQPGIPPGQFIGVVAQVTQAQTSPTQTAIIDQLQSFYTAALVEVR